MITTFCRRLRSPSCAQQCSTRPGHLSLLTKIDDGVITINDAIVTITDNNGARQSISRTYLATFDVKIEINKTVFINSYGILERSQLRSPSRRLILPSTGNFLVSISARVKKKSLLLLSLVKILKKSKSFFLYRLIFRTISSRRFRQCTGCS